MKARWPERWVAVSDGVRRQLERDGVAPERVRVVASALDPARRAPRRSRAAVREELGVAETQQLVATVGSLEEQKGQRTLLDAAARLAPGTPQLLFIGEGPGGPALRRRAVELGLEARCVWAGEREDVACLLSAADVAVCPSLVAEGSPAALKEALALAVPTVASALDAHREIGLGDGDLFPAGDGQALAGLLHERLAAPAAARERAAELVALTRPFSPAQLVGETLAVYEELLTASRK